MKRTLRKLTLLLAGVLVAAPALVQASVKTQTPQQLLEDKVRHELVMLPYYYIFDNLSYRVDGNHVTLYGEVTRPTLKSDAENVVRRIPGLESVTNNIEVLPLSPFDDSLRVRVARAIYGDSALSRYGLGAVPPIHIIVKNGEVTLEGVVDREADRNIANLRANSVPGVFAVKNNLRIQQS